MHRFALASAAALACICSTPANVLAQQAPVPAAYQAKTISAADASADIAILRRALETIHPGLYRYSGKPVIDAAFARLEAAASRDITELALHGEIAIMLAAIHCDHTKAEMSDALTQFRRANATHLPFRFRIIEGRMIVVSNDGGAASPPVGSEILAINGNTVPNLLLRLAAMVSYDGGTDQAIAAKLGNDSDLMGDDFNENYPSLFGFPSEWTIRWKRVGTAGSTVAVLKPATFDGWTRLDAPDGKYRGEFYSAVAWRAGGKTARLKIDTFVNYRNPVQPTAFLGGFFRTMQANGTEHLILDLRNNGGGSEDVSIALGRYLIGQPFTWSKPVRYKAVRYGDLPQYIETWGGRDARFNPPMDQFKRTGDGWFDRIPVQTEPEDSDTQTTIEHQPVASGGFTGRLTILSGPRVGSGATRTIAQLKERAGAVVIGEDGGGSAEGPTAGALFLITLPGSGLKVRIPEAWNRTNITRWVPGQGVPVDQLVVPTLADFQAGRDRAVEVATTASVALADPAAVVTQLLDGEWNGTLDYRDYGNDQRVTLPTALSAKGLSFAWTFQDGPGKVVTSSERWTMAPSGQSLTIAGKDRSETYAVAELRAAQDASTATMVLQRTYEDDGKRVTERKILTRSGPMLRLTTMTAKKGEPLLMRNAYELTRVGG